jgi:hypothetical protein
VEQAKPGEVGQLQRPCRGTGPHPCDAAQRIRPDIAETISIGSGADAK